MTNQPVQSQADRPRTAQSIRHIPLWVTIVVIIGAGLTITGAFISKIDPTLLTNGSPLTEAGRVYADYMFARSLALAIMVLFLLAVRNRRMLAGFMVLIVLIQLIDVGDDLVRGAILLVPGLLVFALVFLAGAWRLFGQAIWRIDGWRES